MLEENDLNCREDTWLEAGQLNMIKVWTLNASAVLQGATLV